MFDTLHEPGMLTTLRQALPHLLRDNLTVPDDSVAAGAMLWCSLDGGIHAAPQFVAYLPAGHVVDVPIPSHACDMAQAWADTLVEIAVQLDPGVAERARKAHLTVYAPLGEGTDCVDIWLGQAAAPWRAPTVTARRLGRLTLVS